MPANPEQPPKFSVIVPAYNEEICLCAAVKEIFDVFEKLQVPYEIILVNDGSTDRTGALIEELALRYPGVVPVQLQRNSGKGHAIKKGVSASSGRYVVFMDADLDIHPAQFTAIFNDLEKCGCDVAIGSKRHPDSEIDYPFSRMVISVIYYWIIKLLLRLNVRDTQAGFKIYKREVLTSILPRILVKQFAFDLEMLVAATRIGFRIKEFPIKVVFSRPYGRITLRDCWNTGLDTLAVFYRNKILDFYGQPVSADRPDISVSIIIPLKTPDENIERCLRACLDQDHENAEIILLPDADSEGLDPFRAVSNIRIIPTGSVNPSVKRNLGAAEASGDVLAFLDDDAFPNEYWISSAVKHFCDETIAAVGGPAVTPEGSCLRERVGGHIYASPLVSGNYRYRYVPYRIQTVDDYPSCNLFVKKNVFMAVGGFSTQHWPGEDTLLCRAIRLQTGNTIVYDPHVVVEHRRRAIFRHHLAQVGRYALHRGYFIKHWPENSFKISYLMPSILVACALAGFGLLPFPHLRWVYIGAAAGYLLLMFLFSIVWVRPAETVLTWIGSMLTHFTYGVFFIKGLLTKALAEHKPAAGQMDVPRVDGGCGGIRMEAPFWSKPSCKGPEEP
jgi:glycosyltransferase involved in cell wall biosynthesis